MSLTRLTSNTVSHRCDKKALRGLVATTIRRRAARLEGRELKVVVDDAAKDFLGEVGWDPQFGARPLKRAIQQELENPLAQKILAGEYAPGETISVTRAAGFDALSFGRVALN